MQPKSNQVYFHQKKKVFFIIPEIDTAAPTLIKIFTAKTPEEFHLFYQFLTKRILKSGISHTKITYQYILNTYKLHKLFIQLNAERILRAYKEILNPIV